MGESPEGQTNCAFFVPSGVRYHYKPWLDQILVVHGVSDERSRRAIAVDREVSAIIRHQSILEFRRLRAAKHVSEIVIK